MRKEATILLFFFWLFDLNFDKLFDISQNKYMYFDIQEPVYTYPRCWFSEVIKTGIKFKLSNYD